MAKPKFEYVDGAYEWDPKCKRDPPNPGNGTMDGGKDRPSSVYDLDNDGKLGPLPRK